MEVKSRQVEAWQGLVTMPCPAALTPALRALRTVPSAVGRLQAGLFWWKREGWELHTPHWSPDFSL